MPPENPHPTLLDRVNPAIESKKVNEQKLYVLEEMVNYGSNLTTRCLEIVSHPQIQQLVVFGVFLRQVVTMLDGALELIKIGAPQAAALQLRAAFEASLFIDLIHERDGEMRAKFFVVRETRRDLQSSGRILNPSGNFTRIESEIGNEELSSILSKPQTREAAQEQFSSANKKLQDEWSSKINNIYDQKRGKKFHDVQWYECFGYDSIASIATRFNLFTLYTLVYDHGSRIMHTSSFKEHIEIIGDTAYIWPIRTTNETDLLLKLAITIAHRIYPLIIAKYLPEQHEAYWQKYIEDWRTGYKS